MNLFDLKRTPKPWTFLETPVISEQVQYRRKTGPEAQKLPKGGLTDFRSNASEATRWLEDVYSMCARGEKEAAIDVVFDQIERLLSGGEFEKCDSVLRAVDLQRLSVSLILSLLSVTLSASKMLPYRRVLTARTEAFFGRNEGAERAARLLNGLI